MPNRKSFISQHDIVYCDPLQYSGAASGGGMFATELGSLPSNVRKSLMSGGKIYKDLIEVMWAVHTNQTGGLLLMRTPHKRIDCILFFCVQAGEGRFFPGQFTYEGPISYVSKVYWTRKSMRGLVNRLRIPGLVKKAHRIGLTTPEPKRVTRDDYMVTDPKTGKSRLGCVNFFDDEVSSLEDVVVQAQLREIIASHEGGDYWVT